MRPTPHPVGAGTSPGLPSCQSTLHQLNILRLGESVVRTFSSGECRGGAPLPRRADGNLIAHYRCSTASSFRR